MHKAEGCARNWWISGFWEPQVSYRTIIICTIAPPTTYLLSCTKPTDGSIPCSQYTLSRTCSQAKRVVYKITTITYLFILNFHVQFIYMHLNWFLHLQSNWASIAWLVKVESESWSHKTGDVAVIVGTTSANPVKFDLGRLVFPPLSSLRSVHVEIPQILHLPPQNIKTHNTIEMTL